MSTESLKSLSRFYITSGGRIWGLRPETEDTEAQNRRNVMGNSFDSLEKAALAKARIEAWARVKDYAIKKRRYDEGKPVLEFTFNFPKETARYLEGDLRVLIDDNMDVEYVDPLENSSSEDEEPEDNTFEKTNVSYSEIPNSSDEDEIFF